MTALINASTSSGLITTADTSGTLALQSNGTTQFTVSSTGAYGQLKSGTAVSTTSGTSIDFTSIPSWVKRITVMFSGVSTNGTSNILIQIGSGSVTTSGYTSGGTYTSNSSTFTAYTTGIGINTAIGSGTAIHGSIVLSLINNSSNVWIGNGVLGDTAGSTYTSGGSKTLSGTLDRVRITTVNGTDTFDAGSINIMYEG
jgi:hypothetical protein